MISNTDTVHLKKEDYSPINKNEFNKKNDINNIILLQKKLFNDNNNNNNNSYNNIIIDEIEDKNLFDLKINE